MLSSLFYRSSLEYWQKATLDYNWYWILAVFLGWTGLDMLYLRSPMMAIVKVILNILTLGYYWFYDAIEATFNKDQVKAVGPTMPFYGTLGLAGGLFRGTEVNSGTEEEKSKHYTFLLYTFVLLLTGVFGGDSFLTGYSTNGYVRILLLISVIGAPIALLWYGYNIYKYLFRQDLLFDGLYDFFGAPKPADAARQCPNVLETTTAWAIDTVSVIFSYIPILSWFAPFLKDLATRLYQAYGIVVNTAEAAMEATDYIQAVPSSLSQPQQLSQQGGATIADSASATMLGIVILSIIVSAVGATLWRNKQNVPPETNQRHGERSDDPPQPGNVGKTNKV